MKFLVFVGSLGLRPSWLLQKQERTTIMYLKSRL
jgi:hypothetical protein